MKRYRIIVPVVKASGSQVWEGDAENAVDALQRYRNGVFQCVEEVLNAEITGEPEVEVA